MKNSEIKNLDIIIPISLEANWVTYESVVECILMQNQQYGFTRFALSCPCGGWRSIGYPPKSWFENRAELFLKVKNKLTSYGIECGWWITATLKSGTSPEFTTVVKENGEEHPFSNCPIDEKFRKCFSENVATFAKIAKPAFIITEDDFSLYAASGCFCEKHLNEFAVRQGKYYSREELVKILAERTPEAIALIKSWRELIKDSLVGLAKAIRKETDKESPEIPIGYMQAGGVDYEGDATFDIAKAFAGERHTPFSRLYGTFYAGCNSKLIPRVLYHPLYSKQHINSDFKFYHESDTFPHTRYYTSGKQMAAIMSTVYSYGFDGSTFQTQQLLDDPNEETAYGKMFKKERKRFNEVHRIAKQCRLKGVQIDYDPFWNTVDNCKSTLSPLWVDCVSRFGIPYTTLSDSVSFWDERQTKYYDDDVIMKQLSKGLFLDGDAAKQLCMRGYGKYIGVEIGEWVLNGTKIGYDLAAREVICEKFTHLNKGKNMPSAHMLAGGNGKLLNMTVTDERCEVISEFYTFKKELVSPAMTRFENELGGRIVVMGMTLDNNVSQSLFNYRRRNLFQYLLKWCCDEYVFVKDAPEVFIIVNEAENPIESGFFGMLTITNLSEDELDEIDLHLPKKWKALSDFKMLDHNGEWNDIEYERTEDGIKIKNKLADITPMYILGK